MQFGKDPHLEPFVPLNESQKGCHILQRERIIDQLRKRLPASQAVKAAAEDGATATALLDRLTGEVAPELEQMWGEELEKLVLAAAVNRARQQVRPEQFQIFVHYALKGMPASQVASLRIASRYHQDFVPSLRLNTRAASQSASGLLGEATCGTLLVK